MDVLHIVLIAGCVVVGVLLGLFGHRYAASGKQTLEAKIPNKSLADWVFDLGQAALTFATKEEMRIEVLLQMGRSPKEIGKTLLNDFKSFLGGPILAALKAALPFAVDYFDHFLLGHLGTALGAKIAVMVDTLTHQVVLKPPAPDPAPTPSTAPAQAAAQVVALAPSPASSSEVPHA